MIVEVISKIVKFCIASKNSTTMPPNANMKMILSNLIRIFRSTGQPIFIMMNEYNKQAHCTQYFVYHSQMNIDLRNSMIPYSR